MPRYKNPEMNKATEKLKEAPGKIKITSGSASTRESFDSSQRRAGSMTSSGLPRTTPGGIVGATGRNVNPIYNAPVKAPKTLEKKNKNFRIGG
jgi:hypothetical protein